MSDDLSPLAKMLHKAWVNAPGDAHSPESWEAVATAAREHRSAAPPAASTERPTCATCPYWDADPFDSEGGDCHLTPNRRRKKGDDFCGDHPAFPAWIASRRAPT